MLLCNVVVTGILQNLNSDLLVVTLEIRLTCVLTERTLRLGEGISGKEEMFCQQNFATELNVIEFCTLW